jgi:hypothetical protein
MFVEYSKDQRTITGIAVVLAILLWPFSPPALAPAIY